ncbi:iron-containing alcohol dehydrogenase [Pleomorphochaeta sp. DL1XJH-081]|uniref:iron-containing alcohol dehydrogenase n=1 Tax=Pleomorphochaeta sp. DL1XJH-081 TaxID=3409690 RepID=UPI003BB7B7F9
MKAFVDYSLKNRVRTIFGKDAVRLLPELLASLGCHNPLIVMSNGAALIGDKDLLVSGWEHPTQTHVSIPSSFSILSSEEITSETTRELTRLFKKQGNDGIVAVGGGTVMDLAKTVKLSIHGIDATDENNEGFTLQVFDTPCPLILIPTTIGSGSGATQVAYLNDREHGRILRFEHFNLLPDVTIIDPKMTKAVSSLQTAMGVAAILGRAMESLTSTLSVQLTETYALQAIKLLQKHAFRIVHSPHDLEAREGIAVASQMAGYAASTTKAGIAHACAIVIEKFVGIPYGHCMMILLPHALRYNLRGNEMILAKVSSEIEVSKDDGTEDASTTEYAALATIDWVSQFFDSLTKSLSTPAPMRFHDIRKTEGKERLIRPEQLETLAQAIHNSVDLLTSRHTANTQDIIRVLEAAYWGYPLDQDMVRYKFKQDLRR